VTRSTNRSTPEAPAPRHPATVRNVTLGTASTPASQVVMEPSVLQTSGHNALAWAELEDNRNLGTHWASRAPSGLSAPPTLVATGNRRSCILEGT
jgi:hypothetical protein